MRKWQFEVQLEEKGLKYESHIHSYNNALMLINGSPEMTQRYKELLDVLTEISDDMIIEEFNTKRHQGIKSISDAINTLIDMKLVEKGWDRQSPIFNKPDLYQRGSTRWTLDFSCQEGIALEVAFNHGEAVAWNLIKPTLASSINGNIEKRIETNVGIIICATSELKKKGNFDGAIGDYEKFLRYLLPLYAMLSKPLLIIGLEAPEKFEIIEKKRKVNGKTKVEQRDFVIYDEITKEPIFVESLLK